MVTTSVCINDVKSNREQTVRFMYNESRRCLCKLKRVNKRRLDWFSLPPTPSTPLCDKRMLFMLRKTIRMLRSFPLYSFFRSQTISYRRFNLYSPGVILTDTFLYVDLTRKSLGVLVPYGRVPVCLKCLV